MKLKLFSKNKTSDQADASVRPRPQSSLGHRLSSDPFLDWVIILAIALLVTFALVGIAIYVYLESGTSLESSKSGVHDKALQLPLDQKALTKVLNEFAARTDERSSITRAYSAPKDPSLP